MWYEDFDNNDELIMWCNSYKLLLGPEVIKQKSTISTWQRMKRKGICLPMEGEDIHADLLSIR